MEGRNKMLKEEMEMRIAICDDEKIALEQTCNIVKDVFDEMHIKILLMYRAIRMKTTYISCI